jgi:hypothetical protein
MQGEWLWVLANQEHNSERKVRRMSMHSMYQRIVCEQGDESELNVPCCQVPHSTHSLPHPTTRTRTLTWRWLKLFGGNWCSTLIGRTHVMRRRLKEGRTNSNSSFFSRLKKPFHAIYSRAHTPVHTHTLFHR